MTDPSQASKEALHFQPEWCRVTLASIGDAVITTDIQGRVTFLNSVAESLTGWTLQEATGQSLDCVFRIINEESRQPVESPTTRGLREGVFGLVNHSLLIARDELAGCEVMLADATVGRTVRPGERRADVAQLGEWGSRNVAVRHEVNASRGPADPCGTGVG